MTERLGADETTASEWRMIPMVIGQAESPPPATKTTPGMYLIAMCDVLGFSDFVRAHPVEEVYAAYFTLRNKVRSFQRMAGYTSGVQQAVPVLDGVVFSDTVLFWASATGAPETLPMSLAFLLAQTIGSMPLRIGFAFGKCVIDPGNDVYIGPPIIDAYHTERRQEWVGGAYHPSCWTAGDLRERLLHWRTAIEYPVPVKLAKSIDLGAEGDPLLEYALGWTALADGDVSATLEQQEQHAPSEAKVKWQNARTFYESHRG
jgi:hypothetical protein